MRLVNVETLTLAEQIIEHMCSEPTHETWIGKHYPPCPSCGTTRWHREGCSLSLLIEEHREAVDQALDRWMANR